MILREFKLNDLKEIANIERSSFECPFLELNLLFLSEACRIAVTEINKSIVGYLIFSCDANSKVIHRIAVKKEFRSKLIGQELIKKYVHGKCRVQVLSENTRAIEFYRKCGFEKVAILKKAFDQKKDLIVMIKS